MHQSAANDDGPRAATNDVQRRSPAQAVDSGAGARSQSSLLLDCDRLSQERARAGDVAQLAQEALGRRSHALEIRRTRQAQRRNDYGSSQQEQEFAMEHNNL